MTRSAKQLIIAIVFIVVTVVVAFLWWRSFHFTQATCEDGIQNQNEVGVDCGGSCEACVGLPQAPELVQTPIFIAGEGGHIDLLFAIKNRNPQWGLKKLPYTIVLQDSEGGRIGERTGSTFLLPLEEHFVVEQAIETTVDFSPAKVVVEFGEPVWIEVPDRVSENGLIVLQPTFTRLVGVPEVAEAKGVIRNDAPFSYDRIEVHVAVYDSLGEPVGFRRTEMRTLSSGERREFRVAWRAPFTLLGEPRLEILPLTNVFENENFVRVHGTMEEFQELQLPRRGR